VPDITTAISGVAGAIGRYFGIVSFVPSLLLAGFTFALIKSGAWGGKAALDWSAAGSAFGHLGNIALLVLVSMALGVVVHPIQFSLVQFFEGYWGVGKLAQRVRVVRILRHRARLNYLDWGLRDQAAEALESEDPGATDAKWRLKNLSMLDESKRLRSGYPVDDGEVMPTRLGNVLRKYERLAGSQYGLDAVRVIRQVALVAPVQRIGYVNDQRQSLDLAARMCGTSLAATVIAVAFLWRHGPWLAIALVPYVLAYLSYRGAIVAAYEYGAAVCALIDLDRFAFYDALRVPQPKDTMGERAQNAQLMRLLSHNARINVTYASPAEGSSQTKKDDPAGA
jgi:hypothetical protein